MIFCDIMSVETLVSLNGQKCSKHFHQYIFFAKTGNKNVRFSTLSSHKMAKKRKIKNLLHKKFLNTPENIYTNFQANWSITLGVVTISDEIFFLIFGKIWSKKLPFCPNRGRFLAKIRKFLEINKNPQNTSYVKFLGHFDHYWPFFGNFRPFLGHFWPY